MATKRKKQRWPFPKQDVSPYRQVQLAALRACIHEPKMAPDGYNDVLRAVWSSLLAYRTLPTNDEFMEALDGLYGLLRGAAMPDGVAVVEDSERQQRLLRAKADLDALHQEARACGLLLE
jgi:hypothetical protein